ncbi:MAG: hypothetical protein R3C56_12845 [Pirellulaceae bacterium]
MRRPALRLEQPLVTLEHFARSLERTERLYKFPSDAVTPAVVDELRYARRRSELFCDIDETKSGECWSRLIQSYWYWQLRTVNPD